MNLWPTRSQWQSWSLPSKLTAVGTLIGVISLGLYGIEKAFNLKDILLHRDRAKTESSRPQVSPTQKATPQTDKSETKTRVSKSQTLDEYFKTDFSNYLAVNRKVGIRVFTVGPAQENQHDYEIEFRLHCDFESRTKFLSFYLPSSTFPNGKYISKVVAEQAHEITSELIKGMIVEGSRYNDRMTAINDLKFTGRVYIYHDAYLSANEIDELRNFYKQRSLDPVFRGSNYLIKRSFYENRNSSSTDIN